MKSLILLVGDEKGMAQYEQVFQQEYGVFKVQDAATAAELLENHSIVLVISETDLPKMDGFELCYYIKTNRRLAHIPVILLTTKNGRQENVKALEKFADACIKKPFRTEFLKGQVRSLLSNKDMAHLYVTNSKLGHVHNITCSRSDRKFLDDVHAIISKNISDYKFDIIELARRLNMSRATLYRKLKEITDLSPKELISISRLKKATELLAEGRNSIPEVSLSIGYDIQSAFSRDFNRQFGLSPTQYIRNLQIGWQ